MSISLRVLGKENIGSTLCKYLILPRHYNFDYQVTFSKIKFITVIVINDPLNDQFIKCANKEKVKQEKKK